VLASLAALTIVLALLASVVELPYYAISPGSARPTEPVIVVDGAESYPSGDEILFTTVSIAPGPAANRHVNGWEWLQAQLDGNIDLVDAELIDGGRDPSENAEINQQLMDQSQEIAIIVALEHLGYDVVDGTGATVTNVIEGYPADGHLDAGDTVVRAGGRPVERSEDLVRLLDAATPGDELRLVVEPEDGRRRTEVIELGENPNEPGQAFLGVAGSADRPAITTRDEQRNYPFDVSIDPGQVRGPSAGLAFTLAVLDVLTPGDISGDVDVAVTGTIDGLGRVGLIGGAQYKAVAARRAGADVFLVPAGEEEQAAERVGDDVEIIPVATLDDALEALADLGGNALDLERPVPSAS